MWDILHVIHEGTTEVKKKARMNKLAHEYESFRMKHEKIFRTWKNNLFTFLIT